MFLLTEWEQLLLSPNFELCVEKERSDELRLDRMAVDLSRFNGSEKKSILKIRFSSLVLTWCFRNQVIVFPRSFFVWKYPSTFLHSSGMFCRPARSCSPTVFPDFFSTAVIVCISRAVHISCFSLSSALRS